MKKLFVLSLAVLLAAGVAYAQTVTCSVSGTTTKQNTQFAAYLAELNAARTAQGLPTLANFAAWCADTTKAALLDYVASRSVVDSQKVGAAALAHGDETATNAQCSAASLANGCTKSQAACMVLSGNVSCQ